MPFAVLLHGVRPGGRRSVRLAPPAYADAAVFVTVVTAARVPTLCRIGADAAVRLTWIGEVVAECLVALPDHVPAVTVDAWVVMPDHIHAVLWVAGDRVHTTDRGGRGAACCAPTPPHADTPPHAATPHRSDIVSPHANRAMDGARFVPVPLAPGSLAVAVRAFKSAVTRRVNDRRGTPGAGLWQRGFHDHRVRDAADLDRIRRYVADNPAAHVRDRRG